MEIRIQINDDAISEIMSNPSIIGAAIDGIIIGRGIEISGAITEIINDDGIKIKDGIGIDSGISGRDSINTTGRSIAREGIASRGSFIASANA